MTSPHTSRLRRASSHTTRNENPDLVPREAERKGCGLAPVACETKKPPPPPRTQNPHAMFLHPYRTNYALSSAVSFDNGDRAFVGRGCDSVKGQDPVPVQSSISSHPLRATRARGQLGASDLKAGSNGSGRHDVRAAIWRGSTYSTLPHGDARAFLNDDD